MSFFDILVGAAMFTVATVVFIYYSAWVFILPFVDEESILNSFFLPREWAIRIPAILLILGSSAVMLFISSVLIKSAQKKSLKKKSS